MYFNEKTYLKKGIALSFSGDDKSDIDSSSYKHTLFLEDNSAIVDYNTFTIVVAPFLRFCSPMQRIWKYQRRPPPHVPQFQILQTNPFSWREKAYNLLRADFQMSHCVSHTGTIENLITHNLRNNEIPPSHIEHRAIEPSNIEHHVGGACVRWNKDKPITILFVINIAVDLDIIHKPQTDITSQATVCANKSLIRHQCRKRIPTETSAMSRRWWIYHP